MKTNYMIALKVPIKWKAPWRMPQTQVNGEAHKGSAMYHRFHDKLEETIKSFQNILKKHWLHD